MRGTWSFSERGWRPSQPAPGPEHPCGCTTHTGDRRTGPPAFALQGWAAEPCPRPGEDPVGGAASCACGHEASLITAAHPAALGFPADSSGSPLIPRGGSHFPPAGASPTRPPAPALHREPSAHVCVHSSLQDPWLGRQRALRRWLSAHGSREGATLPWGHGDAQVTPGQEGGSCGDMPIKAAGGGREGWAVVSWEGGRLFPGPECSERGRPPWSARPGSQPQMQKRAVRLAGRRGGPSAAPLSCFAPTGASAHARPGCSSVCPCDPPPAAGRGSGSPHWRPGPSSRLCHPRPSAEARPLRGHRPQMEPEPCGCPGPRPWPSGAPEPLPRPARWGATALHGVKPKRFSSAPADCLSSGLISKTSRLRKKNCLSRLAVFPCRQLRPAHQFQARAR